MQMERCRAVETESSSLKIRVVSASNGRRFPCEFAVGSRLKPLTAVGVNADSGRISVVFGFGDVAWR